MRRHVGLAAAVMLSVLAANAAAFAESDDLKRAKQLFEQREYLASQEALLRIDRASLSEADRAEFDRLAQVLPEAVQGQERAAQDVSAGDAAYEAGRWDEADARYQAVSGNRYASEAQLARARTQRQRIQEKKQLAESARPSGPASATPAAPPAVRPEPAGGPAGQPAAHEEPAAPPPTRMTIVDQLRERDRLLWQQAEAHMRDAARQAREALAEGRHSEARQFGEQALRVIEAARAYAEPPSRYEAARAEAEALRHEVSDAIDRADIERAAQAQREVAEQVARRRAVLEQQKREKVEQLFNTADQLRRERKFREAAEAVRQAMFIDPSNAKAAFLLETYEDMASLSEQSSLDKTLRTQQRGMLEETREALVPWYQDILYPRNWVELSNRRRATQTGFGYGGGDELNRLLDKERALPELSFEEATLERVLDHLGETSRANITVDWEDLSAHGVERDKPVSIRLRDVSFRTALDTLLSQAAGDRAIGFAVADGVIRVASRDKLDRNKYLVVYDIRDLMTDVPYFAGPTIDMEQAAAAGAETITGSSLFSGPREPREDRERPKAPNAAVAAEIMKIIRETVEPHTWREAGGDGALRELNGQLIVYGTSDAHRQTTDLLRQLRDAHALQIAVESRFLIVTSNFLEEIGVDLDFVFNSGTAGFDPAFGANGGVRDNFTGASVLVPREFSRIGAVPAIPPVATPLPQNVPFQPYSHAGFVPAVGGIPPEFNNMTPIPVQQGGINLVNPTTLNTGVPGSLGPSVINPALSLAGSFLDNLQVDFLIRATQANRRASIVQAPRLLMFNSQRAFVAISRNRQYVASLTPAVAEGAVGVNPNIQFIASGTVLDVEGTISSDRRYVTLTVRTTLTEEPTFDRFEIQRQSGNSPGLFVLLPDQQTRRINTTCSVPDGGTVLLGGLKQSGEVEIEAGVPILSKIPVLKRAFTNSSTAKDSQTLLILLKAKILIQKEAEEDVFPTLSAVGAG